MKCNEMIIELHQMPSAELQEIRNRNNGHINDIAFDADDIETAFNELIKLSFNIIQEAPMFLFFWKNGSKYFNITVPDGEQLEVNQIL